MGSVTPRKADKRSTLEMRTAFGESGKEYLLVKVRRRGADHFNAFAACELKEAPLTYWASRTLRKTAVRTPMI